MRSQNYFLRGCAPTPLDFRAPKRRVKVGVYPRPQERPPPPCGGSLDKLAALGVDLVGEFLELAEALASAGFYGVTWPRLTVVSRARTAATCACRSSGVAVGRSMPSKKRS